MNFENEIARAQQLESAGLWRRATRQWLVVLDCIPAKNEDFRAKITARRARCAAMGNIYCGEYSGITEAHLVDHSDMGVAA